MAKFESQFHDLVYRVSQQKRCN